MARALDRTAGVVRAPASATEAADGTESCDTKRQRDVVLYQGMASAIPSHGDRDLHLAPQAQTRGLARSAACAVTVSPRVALRRRGDGAPSGALGGQR